MKKLAVIVALSLAWFLVLPIRFQYGGWHIFGGYRFIKPYLPYADSFSHESSISQAYVTSHIYPLGLFAVSVALGTLTYLAVHQFRQK